MPTLEDTIDFPVTTLSDLLEADAKTGIAAAPDEEKYRRWAFLSTGAAGILAVILLVVLITGTGGGGGDDGGGKDVAKPPGTESSAFTVTGALSSDIKPGAIASVLTEDGTVIVSGGTVRKITQTGKEGSITARKTMEMYVQKDEASAIAAAKAASAKFTVEPGTLEKTPPTTVAPAPAEQPPAETPPAETPPASG
jgi:hypothetical protein